MSAPPYQKFFWGSYHKHTAHLSHAGEHGAYLLLIGALWNNDGKLPADDATLAGYAKLSLAEWKAIKPKLVNGKLLKIVRGKLTQPRVVDDLAKYKDTSGKRKVSGKSGGLASARKQKENRPAIATILPTKPEPEPEPEEVKVGGGERATAPTIADDWPEKSMADLVPELCQFAGSPWLDHHKNLRLITTAGSIAAWKRTGASYIHDVLPTIAAVCANQREAVQSWKFFDAAIARSMADNRRTLTIPEASRSDHERARPLHPANGREARRGVWADIAAEEAAERARGFG